MAYFLQAVDALALLIAAWAWHQLFLLACAGSPSSPSCQSVLRAVKALLGTDTKKSGADAPDAWEASRWRAALQKQLQAAAAFLQSAAGDSEDDEPKSMLNGPDGDDSEHEDAEPATCGPAQVVPDSACVPVQHDSDSGLHLHTCDDAASADAGEAAPDIFTDDRAAQEAASDPDCNLIEEPAPEGSEASRREEAGEEDAPDREASPDSGCQDSLTRASSSSIQLEQEPAPQPGGSREVEIPNSPVMAETCVEPHMTQTESASEVGDVNDVSEAEVSAEDRHWHLAHTASTCSGKAEIPTQKETSKDPNASSADGTVWDESRGKPAEASWRPSLRPAVRKEPGLEDDQTDEEADGPILEHAQARIWCRRDRGLDGSNSDSIQSSSSRGKPRRAFYKARQPPEM